MCVCSGVYFIFSILTINIYPRKDILRPIMKYTVYVKPRTPLLICAHLVIVPNGPSAMESHVAWVWSQWFNLTTVTELALTKREGTGSSQVSHPQAFTVPLSELVSFSSWPSQNLSHFHNPIPLQSSSKSGLIFISIFPAPSQSHVPRRF